MKEINLTPKAEEDLTAIWDYSYQHFGMDQADIYIGRISAPRAWGRVFRSAG